MEQIAENQSQNQRDEIDKQNILVINQQEKTLSLFNTSIVNLRNEVSKLSTGLSNIAFLIQKDGLEEQKKLRNDQEKERLLAEQKIRLDKEDNIEEKLQSSIAEPVQKLVPKVNNVFSRIGQALQILFLGWLTKSVVDGLSRSGEESSQKLNDIKFNIVKNIGIAIGGLIAIKTGFVLIKRTIGAVSSRLFGLLSKLTKPLKLRSAAPAAGAFSAGGRGMGLFQVLGRIATAASGVMDFMGGENVDAALAAGTVLAPGPLKIPFGLAYGADAIAEMFGGNIFGKNPNENQSEPASQQPKPNPEPKDNNQNTNITTNSGTDFKIAPTASPQQTMMGQNASTPDTTVASPQQTMMGQNASTPDTTVTPATTATASTTTVASPQQTMMGQNASTPDTTVTPATTATASTTTVASPQQTMMGQNASTSPTTEMTISPEREKQFEMAWKYRNNSMARGRIESAWNQLSAQEQQQSIKWAESKGYKWEEMKLTPKPLATIQQSQTQNISTSNTPQEIPTISFESPSQSENTNISNSSLNPPSDPKPIVTLITSQNSNNQLQPPPPPITNGALTDVPLIKSSNPDNFYTLYSQFNYNVVI